MCATSRCTSSVAIWRTSRAGAMAPGGCSPRLKSRWRPLSTESIKNGWKAHAVALAKPVGINGMLVIEVQGAGGGVWTVLGDRGPWTLREGRASQPDCAVSLPVGDWWRVVTLGIGPAEAAARASIAGDSDLA